MDKLTAIKIKHDDGTYSDEIPVSVLSENVEWDSTHTLLDVLGSIDVDVTGTIQDQISQLFNGKVSNSDMQSYVSSSMPTYITNWLNTNVNPVGSAVMVDSSLTISGAAADAAVMGNIKNSLGKQQSNNKFNPLTITPHTVLYPNGNPVPQENSFCSDFIKRPSNTSIIYYVRKTENAFYGINAVNMAHLCQYDINKQFLSRTLWANAITLDNNCAYIRFDNPISQIETPGNLMSITFDTIPTVETIDIFIEPSIYVTKEKIVQIESNIKNHEDSISTINTQVDSIINSFILIESENKLNLLNIILDKMITSRGKIVDNDTAIITNYYIPVNYNDKIVYSGINNLTFYHLAWKMINVVLYDENYNFIKTIGTYVNDVIIDDENCKFIRLTIPKAALNYTLASITINIVPTPASLVQYFTPYRSADGVSSELKNSRKVLWLGTSIPTYGYPQILGRICGATIFNEAIGESCIAKGVESLVTENNICGIRNISGLYGLCQTIEEKQYMIDHWSAISTEISETRELTEQRINIALNSSYETILDPYLTGTNAVSLVILNHAYNDSTDYAEVIDNTKIYDPHTLEGAYNFIIKRIIETNPNIGICIFGHYSDLPTSKENALQKVAERWNIPYYLLKNDLQWSSENITTTKYVNRQGLWEEITPTQMSIQNMWLGDNVHPIGVASTRIAQVSQNIFKDWLKMYCDKVK